MMLESAGKIELKKYAKISKEEDDSNTTEEKNSQMAMFKKLFDVRQQENCDVAMMTGCTANVCLIDEENNKIYFANAGDSRSVLCRKGVGTAMSVDHKPELESEKNRIYKADGWVSEGRVKGNLNLCRSLGDLEYKQNKKLPPEEQMITAFPDVRIEEYSSDCDYIVLACDGVWDCMTDQQICDFIGERLKDDTQLSKIIEEVFDTIVATDINSG
jgi:protein phosphatase 1G